jgi:hypothetical protein
MNTANCPKCGNELPQREGAGRPARYCSTTCKRAAAYEITRLNRRLQSLEDRASNERLEQFENNLTKSAGWLDMCGGDVAHRIAALESEIGRAEGRLLALCADSD